MLYHGVIFNLASAKVCPPAIFETYFSYHRDILISTVDCYMYFCIIMQYPLTAILQLINFTAS